LQAAFAHAYPVPAGAKPSLETVADLAFVPTYIAEAFGAAANDAPHLGPLCQFLAVHNAVLDAKGLAAPVYDAMEQVFEAKTELFLIDHLDKEHCEKMGWPDPYRDAVLFARERDMLVVRYFTPVNELQGGRLAEFFSKWAHTTVPDRALHFLDFCLGLRNPTFDHYLLSSHPALSRIERDKALLRSLLEHGKPILSRLASPTWEADVRKTLGL
jgi:hypothetical protein